MMDSGDGLPSNLVEQIGSAGLTSVSLSSSRRAVPFLIAEGDGFSTLLLFDRHASGILHLGELALDLLRIWRVPMRLMRGRAAASSRRSIALSGR